MSSDSNDSDVPNEEQLRIFKEVTDTQFFTDDLYKKQRPKEVEKSKTVLPSLRKSVDEDEQFNLFRQTPEFRNYVAKHLFKLLERDINSSLCEKKRPLKDKTELEGGIKLFKTSTDFVTIQENVTNGHQNNHLLKRRNTVKECEHECKNIAITLEDIRKEVQAWSNRSKAPVFKYKKNNKGILEQIET